MGEEKTTNFTFFSHPYSTPTPLPLLLLLIAVDLVVDELTILAIFTRLLLVEILIRVKRFFKSKKYQLMNAYSSFFLQILKFSGRITVKNHHQSIPVPNSINQHSLLHPIPSIPSFNRLSSVTICLFSPLFFVF